MPKNELRVVGRIPRVKKKTSFLFQFGSLPTWPVVALWVSIVCVALFLIYSIQKDSGHLPVSPTLVREVTIKEFDGIIEKFESKFLTWAERLREKLALVSDMHLRQQLDLPRQLVLINKDNPWRNLYRLKQEQKTEIRQANINFFSYRLLENLPAHYGATDQAVAAYVPPERTLVFPRDMIGMNMLDFVVASHELTHVTQDTGVRSNINTQEQWESYLRFHRYHEGEKPRVILNQETTAYAYELEMFNLLIDGRLRFVVASNDVVDVGQLGKEIGIRPAQQGVLALVIKLASLYFPEGYVRGNFPQKFVNQIARMYRTEGYELYTRDRGTIRKIRSDELTD